MGRALEFRILDLPMELRLMIYEAITIDIKSHAILIPDSSDTMTLNVRTLPTALLATCRFIRDEVTPIFENRMREIIEEIPRIGIEYKTARTPEDMDSPEHDQNLTQQHEVLNIILTGVMFIHRARDIPDKSSVLGAALDDNPRLVTLYGVEDLCVLYQFLSQAARYLASGPAPLPSNCESPKVIFPVCLICLHRTQEQAESHRGGVELLSNIPPCRVEFSTGQPPICADFALDPPATCSVEKQALDFWRRLTYLVYNTRITMEND